MRGGAGADGSRFVFSLQSDALELILEAFFEFLKVSGMCVHLIHMHAHTHTHAHTYAHHTHTHTPPHTHTHIHTRTPHIRTYAFGIAKWQMQNVVTGHTSWLTHQQLLPLLSLPWACMPLPPTLHAEPLPGEQEVPGHRAAVCRPAGALCTAQQTEGFSCHLPPS